MTARWMLLSLTGLALLTTQPAAGGVPVLGRTASGDLVVIELSADGLGTGQVPVRDAGGVRTVDASAVQALPSSFVTSADDGEAALVDLVTRIITILVGADSALAAGLNPGAFPPGPGTSSLPGAPGAPATPDPLSGLASPYGGGGQSAPGATTQDGSNAAGGPAAPSSQTVSGRTFRVRATAEGDIGQQTADGTILKKWTEGAALPSRSALGNQLVISLESTGVTIQCPVIDVGPWNIHDAYWERADGTPRAASGRDERGRRTNGAGIDITDAGWYKLLSLRTFDRRLIEDQSGTVVWSFASQNS